MRNKILLSIALCVALSAVACSPRGLVVRYNKAEYIGKSHTATMPVPTPRHPENTEGWWLFSSQEDLAVWVYTEKLLGWPALKSRWVMVLSDEEPATKDETAWGDIWNHSGALSALLLKTITHHNGKIGYVGKATRTQKGDTTLETTPVIFAKANRAGNTLFVAGHLMCRKDKDIPLFMCMINGTATNPLQDENATIEDFYASESATQSLHELEALLMDFTPQPIVYY